MSSVEINQVLAQMRALATQAGGGANRAAPAADGAGFGDMLKASINDVNSVQKSAESLATQFEQGKPGVDLGQVMVELQRANVSFKAMTEVRNKLVNAYQDIMNMPV